MLEGVNIEPYFQATLYVMIHAVLAGVFASFSWTGFWRYLQWSLEFLFVWPLWLATLALVANLGAALIRKWPFRHDRWSKTYWLAFASLLFIPATIATGVLGAIDPGIVPRPKPSTLAVWMSNGLLAASFVSGMYWVYRMKGLRWFALAVALLQLWILLGAGFITGMALSGDWL